MKNVSDDNRKQVSKQDKIANVVMITIVIVYLAVTIPLLCLVEAFTIHWFLFGLFFFLIPLEAFNSLRWFASDPTLTASQKRQAAKSFCIIVPYLWLLDIFYMCLFNHWNIAIWCLGSFIIILNTTSLINGFLSEQKIIKYFIPFDLLLTIGIVVYMIYIIPITNLQNIVTSIVSAFFGGMLTLVGVAWTIRRQEKFRRLEEIEKAKPLFTYAYCFDTEPIVEGKKACVDKIPLPSSYLYIVNAYLENSDKCAFRLTRVYHDAQWYDLEGNTSLLPNHSIIWQFHCSSYDDIFLETRDILNIVHYYKIFLVVNMKHYKLYQQPIYYTIKNIEEISIEELKKRNISLE